MSSSAGPWSVKGIDPRAREIAKDLARRSGLTLGEWLNHKIADEDVVAPPYAARRPEPQPQPQPQRFAEYARPEPARSEPVRVEYQDSPRTSAELARVAEALGELSDRIESAERRSTLAISGIDQSVLGVVSRLEAVERDHGAVAARFDGALEELRTEQARAGDKDRRGEQAEAVRMEATKALEAALGKVASQLYESDGHTRSAMSEIREDLTGVARRMDRVDARFESDGSMIETLITRVAEKLSEAEQTTSEAIRGLADSFAGLDQRLKVAEGHMAAAAEGEPVERRFERLAADLADKVDQARSEMTERISGAADAMTERFSGVTGATDAKIDRMETALRELGGAVDLAERRSAQAIDRMGREVMRIAHTLGERVGQVEANSTKAVEQVSGEMGRIADAMETRMRQADTAQAAALEKLGGEIGRIAERLAERIAAAERRTSQTADAMSEQAARLAEKVSQRQDQSASDLVERIRQSEERAIKMLQEAQAKLDHRLAETQRQVALEAVRHAEAERHEAPAVHAALDPFPQAAHEPDPFVEEETHPEPAFMAALPHAEPAFTEDLVFRDEMFAEPPPPPAAESEPAEKAAEDEITSAEFKLFDDEAAHEDDTLLTQAAPKEAGFDPERPDALAGKATEEAPPIFAPDEAIFAPEPRSPRDATRQMLDEARAAARQNAPDNKNRRNRPIAADAGAGPVEALPYAPPGLSGFFKLKRKKHSGSTLRTAILASGTAATLSMAAVGYGLLAAGHWGESTPAKPAKEALPPPVAAAAPPPSTDLAAAAIDSTLAADAPSEPASAPELKAKTGSTEAATPTAPSHRPAAAPLQLAVQSAKPPRTVVPAVTTPARPSPAPATAAPAPVATASPNAPLIPQGAQSAASARVLYSTAVRQIETGDNSGLDALRKAANLSYAPAQFYLGKLYETGGAGLGKDAAEARRWTERAAQAGDPKAMHNLALYYFEGDGGPKNSTIAASWFRRAAELGLQDSQYNLARLHEQGYGVAQNPAEAYKWYLIAASGGDADARAGAERTKKQLSADAQAAAERSAGALRAQITGTLRTAAQAQAGGASPP